MANANYLTDLLTTTLEKYGSKTVSDNVFKSHVLLSELKKNAYVKTDGGTKILEPLMYKKKVNGGAYSGYDKLNVDPEDTTTNAEFEYRQYAETVTISGIEQAQNSGEPKMVNMLTTRVQAAELSMAENITQDLYTGVGSSKQIDGLETMISASNTYGNIDRTATGNEFWQAKVTSVGGALTLASMATMYSSVAKAAQLKVSLIMTTDAVRDSLEALLIGDKRYSNTQMADGGFNSLLFRGTPVVSDDLCPTGTMYFANYEFLKLRYMPNHDMKMEAFIKPADQDAMTAKILWYGNLTANNARYLGKLTNIS